MLASFVAIAAFLALPVARAAASTTTQQLAVPAYFDPTTPDYWPRLLASPSGTVAVANPSSGPGTAVDPAYTTVLQQAHAAGIRVLGYVDTGFLGTTGWANRRGTTTLADWTAQVEADVDRWYSFYGPDLDGIFLDDGQNVCDVKVGANTVDVAAAYQALEDYVKTSHPGAFVAANPGSPAPQCFESTADTLVTFEGTAAQYLSSFVPLDWTPADPHKVWHIVYGAGTAAQMAQILQLSKQRGAGYVYVTDDGAGNPYDTLPEAAYWSAETTAAIGNSAGPPTNTTTTTTTASPTPVPPTAPVPAPTLAPPTTHPRLLRVAIGAVAQRAGGRALELQLTSSFAAKLAVAVDLGGRTLVRRTIAARSGRHWLKLPLPSDRHGRTRRVRGRTVRVLVAGRADGVRVRASAQRRVRARP